jgi:hypothetical protein
MTDIAALYSRTDALDGRGRWKQANTLRKQARALQDVERQRLRTRMLESPDIPDDVKAALKRRPLDGGGTRFGVGYLK